MKITNICDFKRLVIQINGITDLIRRRVRLEHIDGFGCRRILRVRLEHSAVLRLFGGLLTVHCRTQERDDSIISGKMAEIVNHAAVAVTDVLTLGVRSAVRHQHRKLGFVVACVQRGFRILRLKDLIPRSVFLKHSGSSGNIRIVSFFH